jgi:hypothetical protein
MHSHISAAVFDTLAHALTHKRTCTHTTRYKVPCVFNTHMSHIRTVFNIHMLTHALIHIHSHTRCIICTHISLDYVWWAGIRLHWHSPNQLVKGLTRIHTHLRTHISVNSCKTVTSGISNRATSGSSTIQKMPMWSARACCSGEHLQTPNWCLHSLKLVSSSVKLLHPCIHAYAHGG